MMNLKKNTKVAVFNCETPQDETAKVKHHQPEMAAEPPVMVTAGSLRRLKRKLLLQYAGVPLPASMLVVRRDRSSSEGSSSTATAETSST